MYSESVTSQTDSVSTEDMAQEAVDTRSPQLASVNYLALDAIAAAITGAPFHDTEFAVAHKGKDQFLYAHSTVIRRACPVLFKSKYRCAVFLRLTMRRDPGVPDGAARLDGARWPWCRTPWRPLAQRPGHRGHRSGLDHHGGRRRPV